MEKTIYNSTVRGKILITPDLMILRVKTDEPREKFAAGQYTSIGVLASEDRSPNSVLPIEDIRPDTMIIRPYSIASANHETQNFEFYISQVKSGQLTPRLFNLSLGSRMWVDTHILGLFTLKNTPPDCNILMIATGTGLAPYISFLRSHMKEHTQTKMAVIHGAGYPWDLGYYSELQFMGYTFDNFYYLPTLLKPDRSWTGLTGYIESHLESGLLKERCNMELDPEKTHVYICGNPKMIETVSTLLTKRGYQRHTSTRPGSLHIEEY